MIEEMVTRYKDDERIIIWNVYNEVGNSKRAEVTLPNLKEIFEIIFYSPKCDICTRHLNNKK